MYYLGKPEEEKYFKELVEVIQVIGKDRKLLHEFFEDLLTPSEYKEIGLRWQIVKRLAKRMPHRKIAKDLEVSITTVTRGSRELLDKDGGFQKTLEKISSSKR